MKPIQLLAIPFLLLAACDGKRSSTTPSSVETSAVDKAALDSVLNAVPKGEARSIKEVKASAAPGDEITLKGRIMGNANPFVANRAAFMVADPSLIAACNDKPGDNCETPWDVCCHTPEEITKASATIQIVGADGRVLKQAIEGVGGLAKLATVTVSGKVAKGSGGDVLIINASAIRADK